MIGSCYIGEARDLADEIDSHIDPDGLNGSINEIISCLKRASVLLHSLAASKQDQAAAGDSRAAKAVAGSGLQSTPAAVESLAADPDDQ